MSKRMDDMIAAIRAQISEKGEQRKAARDIIETVQAACLGENRSPSDDEAKQVREATPVVKAADDAMAELRQRLDELIAERDSAEQAAQYVRDNGLSTPSVKVTEKRTYRAGGQHSFFADAYSAGSGYMSEARERIDQHIREARVEGEMSQRAQTTGGANGLVIPQYLIDQYALVARAGRPLANVVRRLDLPAEGMSIIIPRGTTGATVAAQATENTAASNTDEVWATLTVPVVTIAGEQDVSTQLLTRGGAQIDEIVFQDIAGAYAVQLDTQVGTGTGTGGTMLGITSTSGITTESAFGATITVQKVYSKVIGGVNDVQTKRDLPPDMVVMHPRRWNWLLTQFDSNNRPLVVPNASGAFNAVGTAEDGAANFAQSTVPAGTFAGLPVLLDANLPTNVGTNSEDQILVLRSSDLLLWEENDGMPKQIRFDQTLGGQLTTKLVAYGFAAFTAGRYPTAVSVIGGQDTVAGDGLIAPTF